MRQNRHVQKMQPKVKPKATTPKNTKSSLSLGGRFKTYLGLHAHALFSSLGRLLKTPFTSVMTIIVLAIAIALASGFYVLLGNAEQFTGSLDSSNQISLFLKKDVNDLAGRKLADKIKLLSEVIDVKLITQEKALAEFKDFSGFGEAINALASNPLPTVIQVFPKDELMNNNEIQSFVDELGRLDEVDLVQMDLQWVRRLQSMIDLAQRGVLLLGFVLSFAVLFIMGNTIRLELEDRRDEVLIAKLVGATYAFIQRPFLYAGFWFGFFAGVSAWLIVALMMLGLEEPIERLAVLYEGDFQVLFLNFTESLMMLFISSMLGVTGSWMVLHYQLRQMKLE